jgi:hypothetical protein
MSDQVAEVRPCIKCGVAIELCAFCDEPQCKHPTCHRCVNIGFLDRKGRQATASSAAPAG